MMSSGLLSYRHTYVHNKPANLAFPYLKVYHYIYCLFFDRFEALSLKSSFYPITLAAKLALSI